MFFPNKIIKFNFLSVEEINAIRKNRCVHRITTRENLVVDHPQAIKDWDIVQRKLKKDDVKDLSLIIGTPNPHKNIVPCASQMWNNRDNLTKHQIRVTVLKSRTKHIPFPIIGPKIDGKFISIMARNRPFDIKRNLGIKEWDKICEDIKSAFPNYNIVAHGLQSETILTKSDIICNDIYESVSYLNSSLFLVTSMSGYGQFASNCNCDLVQIGANNEMVPYNPFNNLYFCIEKIENFKIIIKSLFKDKS